MKPQTEKVSRGQGYGKQRVLILGSEIVPFAEPGEITGWKVAMSLDESGYWIVEDRTYGSRLTEGWYTLAGIREEVQRRQSELDALRRAIGEAESTWAGILDDRESKKDRHSSRRRDGGLAHVKTWMAE